MRIFKFCVIPIVVFFVSCAENKTAQIWTDRPEFALYAELFNASQSQYKVTVRFAEFSGADPQNAAGRDIIVGSRLKNASTGQRFRSLDNLFGAKKLSGNAFYRRLLAAGRIGRRQFLLPVSFNIPALVFSRDKDREMSNQFTIDFDEIKRLSQSYNTVSRGAYTRMGFSPLWSDNFLLTAALLSGTSFREADPLAWDRDALENSMDFIYNWTHEINTGSQAEDDFTFKYFFEPPERLIRSGRILFSYMESADFFTLTQETRENLDLRWIMEQDKIPVTGNSVFLGIPKRAKSLKAVRAFILWFFRPENQRQMMEYSRTNRINENTFGICGGFSAIGSVTGQIYPLFYPKLLGRMPPSDNFTIPGALPSNWLEIRERAVLPYLHDRVRSQSAAEIYPLEKRIEDMMKMTR